MRALLISSFVLLTAVLVGCADDASTSGSEDEVRSGGAAQEGQTCGNGFFGTPRISCASGLVCTFPESTAPTGPSGSSSALPGKCSKAGAKEGQTCGNGFFGTPQISCADGLVCKYPESTAPTGPAGSSSAIAGKCGKAGAKEGETCGSGFFGTPKIDCDDGLVCKYPDSTAPRGPAGSSSALPGKCGKSGAKLGETCGSGFFGTPKIDCAAGLVCKYPDSTAPTGPAGSSSALPGKCDEE